MGSPYRDPDVLMLCPRCGDLLVRVFDAVRGCSRCDGVWLPNVHVEKAFGSPAWPPGTNAWWRQGRVCPECAAHGDTTAMAVIAVGPVAVDRCLAHGTWFDEGELRRLLEATGSSDLAALHDRLAPGAPLPDLDTWRGSVDAEQQKVQLAAYRARQVQLADERARELAEQMAEHERQREAVARANELLSRWQEEEAQRAFGEARAQDSAARQKARERRAARTQQIRDMSVEVERIEAQVLRHRADLRDAETVLARVRSQLAELIALADQERDREEGA